MLNTKIVTQQRIKKEVNKKIYILDAHILCIKRCIKYIMNVTNVYKNDYSNRK